MDADSDTALLIRLKSGTDPEAAQHIWSRYFERLARVARQRLSARTRRAQDEEDVALSALDSFFRGVSKGRFPRLDDQHDLWQVLVMITDRKAIDRIRRETCDKRGGGMVRGDSVFENLHDSSLGGGVSHIEGSEPDPSYVAEFSESCQQLFGLLDQPELKQIAMLKLEGLSNDEIATLIGRSLRSVQRKLEMIRAIWDQASQIER